MMEQVRLCSVWAMENWLGSFLNHIQGRTTVREYYSRALEEGPLREKGGESGESRSERERGRGRFCFRAIALLLTWPAAAPLAYSPSRLLPSPSSITSVSEYKLVPESGFVIEVGIISLQILPWACISSAIYGWI